MNEPAKTEPEQVADVGAERVLGIPRRSQRDAVGLLLLTTAVSIAGTVLLYRLAKN